MYQLSITADLLGILHIPNPQIVCVLKSSGSSWQSSIGSVQTAFFKGKMMRNHLNGIMKWAILQIDRCPKPSVSLPGLHPKHVKVNPNRWFPFQELPRRGLKSGFLIEQTHSHHFLLKLNQVPIDRDHLKCFCHQQISFREHFQQTILFVISNWQRGWGFNHTISWHNFWGHETISPQVHKKKHLSASIPISLGCLNASNWA